MYTKLPHVLLQGENISPTIFLSLCKIEPRNLGILKIVFLLFLEKQEQKLLNESMLNTSNE